MLIKKVFNKNKILFPFIYVYTHSVLLSYLIRKKGSIDRKDSVYIKTTHTEREEKKITIKVYWFWSIKIFIIKIRIKIHSYKKAFCRNSLIGKTIFL
jgi:hypothetical protein